MSRLIDLRDAIVARLSAPPAFDPAIVITGHFVPPVYDLQAGQLDQPQVSVVPATETLALLTRGHDDDLVGLEVCLSVRIDPSSPATTQALFTLREALVDRLRRYGPASAAYVGLECDPLVDPESYQTRGVFQSLITVRYRMALGGA